MAKKTRRRLPLTKDRVLRAALKLADRDGIASLSMRRLGEELGIEAMSLYNHVKNKDDLLDGLIDIVFSEIELPQDTDWKSCMRRRAISAGDVLARHRWAIGLMESRTTPGGANLRHHDAVLRTLREAGFSVEMAAHAYSTLDSYIYGFALQQATLPFETNEQLHAVAETMMQQFTADYPYLTEITTELVARPGYSFADEFEFGLDLLLDGLEQHIGDHA